MPPLPVIQHGAEECLGRLGSRHSLRPAQETRPAISENEARLVGLGTIDEDGRRHVIQLPAIVRRGLENFAGRPTRN
jgi:hypothetical protein